MPLHLFTAEEVAALFGLHRSRLYAAISRHIVTPTARAGRAYTFHADSLPVILNRLRSFITAEEYDRGIQNLILNGLVEPDQSQAMKEKNEMITNTNGANPTAEHVPINVPIALPPGCQPETKKLFRELAAITDPFTATKFVRDVVASGAWRLARFDIDRQVMANPGWRSPGWRTRTGPNQRRLTPAELNHI